MQLEDHAVGANEDILSLIRITLRLARSPLLLTRLLLPIHSPNQKGVVATGGDDLIPLGGKRYGEDSPFVPAQDSPLLAAARVPNPRRAIATSGSDKLAVRRIGNSVHGIFMP